MKNLLWMLMLAVFVFLLSERAFASEEDQTEAILDQLYEDAENVTVLEGTDTDQIGSLSISQSFDEEINYTFADELMISGTGNSFDVVLLVVYTEDEHEDPVIWYQQEITIGASGILEQTVDLSLTGEQQLLIGVTNEDGTSVRIYTIVRKSTEVLEDLLDYRLNLYEAYGQP